MDGPYRAVILAELRREELLQQAERYRQAKSAADLYSTRPQRASDLRTAILALGARIEAMRRRREVVTPIDLMPAATETA